MSISPGLSYAATETLQVYGFLQKPVYQHVNGVQLTADKACGGVEPLFLSVSMMATSSGNIVPHLHIRIDGGCQAVKTMRRDNRGSLRSSQYATYGRHPCHKKTDEREWSELHFVCINPVATPHFT